MAENDTNDVDVYVKMVSGRTSCFRLSKHSLVQEICTRIAEEEKVPVDCVTLKYTGKQLDHRLTIGYTGIRTETILRAEITKLQFLAVNVNIDLPTEKMTISVQTTNICRVGALKTKICSVANIADRPEMHYDLKLNGNFLLDEKLKLLDVGITDECYLELIGHTASVPVSAALSIRPIPAALSVEEKNAVLNSFRADGKSVDVVFSFDTTGSMYDCIDQVRQELCSAIHRLIDGIPRIRIGIMSHGDYCDQENYVVTSVDLTSSVENLVDFVTNVSRTSGGDEDECYEWVLHKAQQLDWSEDSAKALVVIGDSMPHEAAYTDQNIDWRDELDVLRGMGVKVYGVQVRQGLSAKMFYRDLAEHTGGAYLQFTDFQVVADMFLAVCYRETSVEQYEQFRDEVNDRADLSDVTRSEVKELMRQMDNSAKTNNETDATSDGGNAAGSGTNHWNTPFQKNAAQLRCAYTYDSASDTWTEASFTNGALISLSSRITKKFSLKSRRSPHEAAKCSSTSVKTTRSPVSRSSLVRISRKTKCSIM